MRLSSTGVRKNELTISASSKSRPTVVTMGEMADGLDGAQGLAGERVCPQLDCQGQGEGKRRLAKEMPTTESWCGCHAGDLNVFMWVGQDSSFDRI